MSRDYTPQPLSALRQKMFDGLGFIDPLSITVTRALDDLILDMSPALGFGALGTNLPPGTYVMLSQFLNMAQQDLWRDLELNKGNATAPPLLVNGSDETVLDYTPVLNLAIGKAKEHLSQPDAGSYFEQTKKYLADAVNRQPPNATTVVNRLLKDAQERLFRTYNIFRMERWFTWTLGAGQRFYDIDENDEQTATPPCTLVMDPRLVQGAWTSCGDNNWRPLRRGIVTEMYNAIQTGPTTHYEIRSCIELWPTPIVGWLLRIKAFYCLLPFEADNDLTTIDWQAIYLTALGDAKTIYKQADAQAAVLRAREYVGDLVAGSHAGARYFPGGDQRPLPMPLPVRV